MNATHFGFDLLSCSQYSSDEYRTNCLISVSNKLQEVNLFTSIFLLQGFKRYSWLISASYIFFCEVPRTWHQRWHSHRFCMDYFSLYALANKSVHACLCQQSPKHKREMQQQSPLFGWLLKKQNTSKDRWSEKKYRMWMEIRDER